MTNAIAIEIKVGTIHIKTLSFQRPLRIAFASAFSSLFDFISKNLPSI